MKFAPVKTAIALAILASCSSADIRGDVDLGNNFYYMPEPAFNSINLSTAAHNPMGVSVIVVPDIEYVGFNDQYILAINHTHDTSRYWIIDKTKQTKTLGYRDHSIALLSNVNESLDSSAFSRIRLQTNIVLLSKADYRHKYNWK